MAFVITDCETAPLQDVDVWLPEFKPAGNIKDAEKRAANVAEKREKAVEGAALDPDLCRIVYLGAWWPDDPHPMLFRCESEEDEAFALREFWDLWALGRRRNAGLQLLGYNLLSFDIVVMLRR